MKVWIVTWHHDDGDCVKGFTSAAQEEAYVRKLIEDGPSREAKRVLKGEPDYDGNEYDEEDRLEGAFLAFQSWMDCNEHAWYQRSEIEIPDPQVILFIEGGVVHDGTADAPVKILVVDADTDGGDQERIVEVEGERVYVNNLDVTKGNPERVAKLMAQARGDHKRICQLCGMDRTPLGGGISNENDRRGVSLGLFGLCCLGAVRQAVDETPRRYSEDVDPPTIRERIIKRAKEIAKLPTQIEIQIQTNDQSDAAR